MLKRNGDIKLFQVPGRRVLCRGSSHADMFITPVPRTRAMRYARVLCYVGEREKEEGERERKKRREVGRERKPVKFHVTGDTMTLYVSLNIFHRRTE